MKQIAAIIAAAGSSSRLGRPKQLVVVDGEAMLQRAIRFAKEAGASPVFVVLGAHRDLIEGALDLTTAKTIVNNLWEEGVASSIRAGMEAVESDASQADGVLMMICDQPRVTADHLRRMISTYAQSEETAIASTYAGTRGIPAVFPRKAFAELSALRGDKGARSLLANPSWPVIEVPLEGGEIDIDCPEDLAYLHR